MNGGNGLPFGNGLRCVGGGGSPIHRLGSTQATQDLLEYTLDFVDPPIGGDILPNSTWNFQAWYLDPQAGGANFDFSEGLTVTFGH